MQMHLSHPLHTSKLRVPYHPPGSFKKILTKDERGSNKSRKSSPPGEQTEDKNRNKKDGGGGWGELATQIRPGEPVPPGMEDVAQRVCQLQTTLDQYHDRPLIGIEYIVELVSMEENTEPRYICLLCEKKGDPRSLMLHLTSQNHNLKYISCFFRTAGNAINMIPRTPETRRGISVAISKVAEEIEKQFGRLKPTSAIAEMFAAQKYDILREIDEKKHFRETPTTTFLQYCTLERVKEYAREAENEVSAAMKRSPTDLPPGTGPNKELKTDAAPNKLAKCNPMEAKNIKEAADPRQPLSKLCFTIGKPERSLGRNVQNKSESHDNSSNKDDDEVIFVATNDDPIEIGSMSSISSDSGGRSPMGRRRSRSTGRLRHRDSRPMSRSRSRERGRRLPRLSRRDSPPRRRDLSPKMRRDLYTRGGPRYRSRSNSRSRERKYSRARDDYSRERERGRRRELERFKGGERERRDRYKRSLSLERDLRKRPQAKSHEGKKKKLAFENNYKMEQYRKKLHDLEVEMDNKLKYFRERPEKHPNYSEEWKNFWNRRYKEIQQSGKDPSTYDFKPEWIIFWDDRMKKLHEEELEQKKEELKKYLPSEDEKGPSDDLQDISPPTPEGERDITVDDIKNTWKALTGSEIKAPVRDRSGSPPEKSPPPLRRSPSPWELELPRMKQTPHPRPKYIDTATPIVHCLRMLSVLEQQLGSLGPKVLDMLSKALTLEKAKVNESMTLLHEEDIHIFFETVKEKIRGQLLAGIVARFLVNSCRSLIGAIENMLSAHPPKAKPKVLKPIIPMPEPVQVEGVGAVNKMAVAQQIAEALVSQGRTDVTQHELEGLINAVVGIAATSNTNLNQSSNVFFSQLNIHKSTANSHINELLSNLISSARESLGVLPTQSQPQTVALPLSQPLKLEVTPESPNPLQQEPLQASAKPVTSASSLFSSVSNTQPAGLLSSKPLPKKTEKEESIPEKGKSKDEEVSESISDDDLKDRLLLFKTLSREKQQQLILLLKELESKEPERVEKLRKYVSLGLTQDSSKTASSCLEESQSGRLSPFSSRAGGTNPAPEEKPPVSRPFAFDSDREDDDDDYTVEDVYKTVSEKLKKKEDERKPVPKLSAQRDLDENSSQSFSNPMQPFSSLSPPPNLFSSYALEPSKAKDPISDLKPSVPEGRPFQALNKTDYKVFPPSHLLESTYNNRTYSSTAEKTDYVEISSYKTNEWQAPDRGSQRPDNKGWGSHETYPGGNRANPGALARDSRSNFEERFIRADIYPAGNRPDAFSGGRAANTAQYGSESRQDMYPGQGVYRGVAPPRDPSSANRTYQQQVFQGSSYAPDVQYKPATSYGGGEKDSGYRMGGPPPPQNPLPPYQPPSYNPPGRPLGYQPPSKGQPYSNNYNRQY